MTQGGKQSLSSPVYPADQKLAKPVSSFKKLQNSAAAGGYFGFWLWFLAGLSAGGGSFWFINRETGFAYHPGVVALRLVAKAVTIGSLESLA